MSKHLPAKRETQVQSLDREDPLEKGLATHSSTLVREISWTEEPGGLQSMGSQRVGHDWATNTSTSPSHTLYTTGEMVLCMFIIRDGDAASLDSVDMNLSKRWEIVEDREAWHVAIRGVAKSQA